MVPRQFQLHIWSKISGNVHSAPWIICRGSYFVRPSIQLERVVWKRDIKKDNKAEKQTTRMALKRLLCELWRKLCTSIDQECNFINLKWKRSDWIVQNKTKWIRDDHSLRCFNFCRLLLCSQLTYIQACMSMRINVLTPSWLNLWLLHFNIIHFSIFELCPFKNKIYHYFFQMWS